MLWGGLICPHKRHQIGVARADSALCHIESSARQPLHFFWLCGWLQYSARQENHKSDQLHVLSMSLALAEHQQSANTMQAPVTCHASEEYNASTACMSMTSPATTLTVHDALRSKRTHASRAGAASPGRWQMEVHSQLVEDCRPEYIWVCTGELMQQLKILQWAACPSTPLLGALPHTQPRLGEEHSTQKVYVRQKSTANILYTTLSQKWAGFKQNKVQAVDHSPSTAFPTWRAFISLATLRSAAPCLLGLHTGARTCRRQPWPLSGVHHRPIPELRSRAAATRSQQRSQMQASRL